MAQHESAAKEWFEYTKKQYPDFQEIKGKTMVRKLMLWKTNKDTVSPEHPAYVLALTDFSPNRKTPLERDIRVSSSLEQIEAYWQVWHAEQFVKGWVVK